MQRYNPLIYLFLCTAFLFSCEDQEESQAQPYDTAPVQYRDIDITVEAAGTIQPETTVDVKSKASGEILVVHAETGDHVQEGKLLVEIDKRTPQNTVDQAQADLQAAMARRQIAVTQINRTRDLLKKGIVIETEFETAELELANAEALVISRQVDLENAKIALDDTDIRAPISGIIIEKNVERGQVISSSTRDVGEGTILLKMADLSTVQVRTLVDETDIGKIRPGMPVTIRVAAFPNQPFAGEVLKIEPQAVVDQNVTMFPVIIRLENELGLLRPGMNAEVDINIAHAEQVLAVPTMALRAERDVVATAMMLGMTEADLRQNISVDRIDGHSNNESVITDTPAVMTAGNSHKPQQLTGLDYQYGGKYWVIIQENGKPVPRPVVTGITDFGHTEVISGLKLDDRVILLPSSATFERQEDIQNRIRQRMRMPGM